MHCNVHDIIRSNISKTFTFKAECKLTCVCVWGGGGGQSVSRTQKSIHNVLARWSQSPVRRVL